MIYKAKKQYDKEDVMTLLDPIIQEWFGSKFSHLTPPQSFAVPLIHERKNVLIASPTGSGKTLTAFLTIINELFELGKRDMLENKVYCIYISPLKALANDIERNLNKPLKEIYELAAERGIELPKIRVGVRSGDTSAYEKQKMVRSAPHILITTPETLAIVLSTTRFRENLKSVRYVILDEIHDVCSSKRGVHLSVSMERLQYQVSSEANGQLENAGESTEGSESTDKELKRNGYSSESSELTRIGLSATQAPINEIAKFLVGYQGNRLRDVHIIEALTGKELDLRVLCPVQDMNLVPFEIVNAKMYNRLKEMIESHRTTLVFTNTRSGTEAVVYRLNERGIESVAAHHGSLSKETRLDVEQKLKEGKLDATITSTSLELGIDIGYIDLVCQIGSPKSIAKGLQRIGRAGHALHEISKGRIIVFDRDDLVECSVLVKSAYDGRIDRISIPKNSLDVLAQTLIGMSLEQRWNVDEAFALIRNSYCFNNLTKRDFLDVLAFIGGHHALEVSGVYGKIWYDPSDSAFGIRRGSRLIYNLNLGTIPQETAYKVTLFGSGVPLGSLSEKFVERLSKGDVFLLGGKTYQFIQAKGMRIYVKDAHGRKPTVPSWTGEMMPRSFDLSISIGRFRAGVGEKLTKCGEDTEPVMKWLADEYYTDEGSARSIVNYIIEQQGINPDLPTDRQVLIEGYIDAMGYKNLIFHYCFGRRVNDALSRAYAYALSKKYGCTVKISLTDDNFMLSFPKRVELEGVEKLLSSENIEELLMSSLQNTELFKQRFRHTAVRSFMILRNYKGRDISVRKQHFRAQRVLDVLNTDLSPDLKTKKTADKKKLGTGQIPVIYETYNEIFHETMDIDNAMGVLKDIESGKIKVCYSRYSNIPSPFAHNVVLMGISDIVLMEDRSALLRELHKQVLAKVVSSSELAKSKFELELVENYFKEKLPKIDSKSSILKLMKMLGPVRLFVEKGRNIFSYFEGNRRTLTKWTKELVNEGLATSIWRNDLAWIPASDLPVYYSVYGKPLRLTKNLKGMMETIGSGSLPDKLDRSEKDDLRRLEQYFVVYRNRIESYGVHNFAIRDIKLLKKEMVPFDEALDHLIQNYLEFHGVSTVAETAYGLSIDEELAQKILRELEDRSIVTSGNFVLGKDVPQFMLLKDMLKLERLSAEAEKAKARPGRDRKEIILEEKDYLNFVLNREFQTLPSISAFFDKYTTVQNKRDIFMRVRDIDMKEWQKLLTGGEVIQGRFQAGRVSYIRRSDISPLIKLNRQADLNAIDRMVLDYIKKKVDEQHYRAVENGESQTAAEVPMQSDYEFFHNNNESVLKNEGVSRSELISSLNLRETDVVDSIEKLDYNLYIARSKRDTKEYGSVNHYIPIEPEDDRDDAVESILLKFLEGQGPILFQDLKNHIRLPGEHLKAVLQSLIDAEKIFKFVVIGESLAEVYAHISHRPALMRYHKEVSSSAPEAYRKTKMKVRILSNTDPFTRRFEFALRNKFGDEWHSAVFEGYKPCGVIQLWKLASAVEIRNIIFDPDLSEEERETLLDSTLDELDNIMKFYEKTGLDILKITAIENLPAYKFSSRTKKILKGKDYTFIQDSYAKGKIIPVSFSPAEITNFILYRQHIHPLKRFEDPMDIVKKFGGIRSTFELHLRLNGRAYDLKEYSRHYDLASGQMIPEFLMYCTEQDARLYRTAKGKPCDDIMEHILSHMSPDSPIRTKELQDRVNLSERTFKAGIKRLYDGLYIVKTPINFYKTVGTVSGLSRSEARKEVVKRIIENFGIFTAENLASFLKKGFSMEEIRALLREFEAEGFIEKGFLVDGDPNLYWVLKGALDSINKLTKNREPFILSPQDPLAHYLSDSIKEKFGMGSCFVVFNGTEMTSAFKASKRGKKFIISDFIGDEDDKIVLRHFAHENRLDLLEKDEVDLYEYEDAIEV